MILYFLAGSAIVVMRHVVKQGIAPAQRRQNKGMIAHLVLGLRQRGGQNSKWRTIQRGQIQGPVRMTVDRLRQIRP